MHQTFNCPHCGAPGQVNYGQASYACTCRLTHQGHYKSTDEAPQQAELDRLRDMEDEWRCCVGEQAVTIDRLRRELAEAQRDTLDARRYRWLRNESTAVQMPLASIVWKVNGDRRSGEWCNSSGAYQIDYTIDAAMAEPESSPPSR
jgi:hypothetical protein